MNRLKRLKTNQQFMAILVGFGPTFAFLVILLITSLFHANG